MSQQTYFDLLNLTPGQIDSTSLEIAYSCKKAEALYESLAGFGFESSEFRKPNMQQIEEAYLVLKDPIKRKQYQREMKISEVNRSEFQIERKLYPEYTVDLDFEMEVSETTVFTGAFLQKIREYKKIDMAKMEELSKVAIRHLRNIEEMNYTELPATVYLRGFLINIARVLELNEKLVASSYLEVFYANRGH